MNRAQTARILIGCAVTLLTCGASLEACPLCDTGNGRSVRVGIAADIRDDGLAAFAAVAAPFLIVGGVVSAIHFGIRTEKRRGE